MTMKTRNLFIILFTCVLSAASAQNRPAVNGSFGYVLLDPGSDLNEQLTEPRTIYEVQNTIDLKNKTLTMPAESILKFNGGLIKNGKVVFDNTYLDGFVQFQSCRYEGQLWNQDVTLSWFGASASIKDNSQIINDVMNVCRAVIVVDDIYPINQTLVVKRRVLFRGLDWNESVYANKETAAHYGFKTTSRINAFRFNTGGRLSLFGISVIGDVNLYVGGNLHETDGVGGKPIETCGILMQSTAGDIDVIYDSSFVGFTYGIRAEGRYIEKIKGTYFSACRFGLWTCWTSDYICQDCHFNTNMLNYNIQSHGINDTQSSRLRNLGAGVVVKGAGMARFLDCKFEFNFIHIIMDEKCVIFNLENCMFDAATFCCIMLCNEKANDNWLVDSELTKPSFNCVNINGNTFVRGARCERYQSTALPGAGILYVRESGNRGMNINFTNNVVADEIELDQTNVSYEKTVFRIFNDGEGGVINSGGNDFSQCRAETVASLVNGSKGRFVIKDAGSNFGNLSHQFENNNVIDIRHTEVDPEGKIIIWKTLTNGFSKSADIILDPTK